MVYSLETRSFFSETLPARSTTDSTGAMADVEMSDAPKAEGSNNGKAVEGKKKFEVKKVSRFPYRSHQVKLLILDSGTLSPSGRGIS